MLLENIFICKVIRELNFFFFLICNIVSKFENVIDNFIWHLIIIYNNYLLGIRGNIFIF